MQITNDGVYFLLAYVLLISLYSICFYLNNYFEKKWRETEKKYMVECGLDYDFDKKDKIA